MPQAVAIKAGAQRSRFFVQKGRKRDCVAFSLVPNLFLIENRRMHPPRFALNHHLLDWPECFLELHCCKGKTVCPVRLLAERNGKLPFTEILARLRCDKCHRKISGPVYLCAGHQREFQGGAAPDWSLEIVPRRNA